MGVKPKKGMRRETGIERAVGKGKGGESIRVHRDRGDRKQSD